MFKSVGVIGAGQMGNGIAQVCAVSGYSVCLGDVDLERASAGVEAISGALARLEQKDRISAEEVTGSLARLQPVSGVEALSDCDLVIEAATENEDIKCRIFETLCKTLKKDAVIASNTSSISITRLAATTDRPDQFTGLHFMNPVPVMQLVELIRGIATSNKTFDDTADFVRSLNKEVTISEDFPAFIVNRVLIPMINEACFALYEGVGSVKAIDQGLKLGANHPMGPLTLADFIGLDTCLSIMQVLYEGLADSKYRPCPLLVKYVEAGWYGRKTGRGFYDYSTTPPTPTR